jgi:hypothetical protein
VLREVHAMDTKNVPEIVAREILAMEEKLRAINSAVEMKGKSIDDILTLSLDAHKVGYLDREKTLDVVGAYLAAHKILTEMLIKLRASPRDLELAQAALSGVTLTGIAVGSASPKLASELQRVVMQTRIANARAKAAARKLTRSCVDQTIIACFEDQSLPRGLKANSQRAAHVLDAVNTRLAAQAAELDVAPTHYGSPDNLRRRYEEAKKRMAD